MLLSCIFIILGLCGSFKGEENSNERLLNQLHQEESRRLREGEDATVIERMPLFESTAEEIKWKLNKAKKTLTKAKQTQNMARTFSKGTGLTGGYKRKHREIQDLISTAERALLEAGERLGYDYEKF